MTDIQKIREALENLHADKRLVSGKYDYQCGFLDALGEIKKLFPPAQPPSPESVAEAVKTVEEYAMTIAEGIGAECWEAIYTLITAATENERKHALLKDYWTRYFPDIGMGDDPLQFILASHALVVQERNEALKIIAEKGGEG